MGMKTIQTEIIENSIKQDFIGDLSKVNTNDRKKKKEVFSRRDI